MEKRAVPPPTSQLVVLEDGSYGVHDDHIITRLDSSSLPKAHASQVAATEPIDCSTDRSTKYQQILTGENIDYNNVKFRPGNQNTTSPLRTCCRMFRKAVPR